MDKETEKEAFNDALSHVLLGRSTNHMQEYKNISPYINRFLYWEDKIRFKISNLKIEDFK